MRGVSVTTEKLTLLEKRLRWTKC